MWTPKAIQAPQLARQRPSGATGSPDDGHLAARYSIVTIDQVLPFRGCDFMPLFGLSDVRLGRAGSGLGVLFMTDPAGCYTVVGLIQALKFKEVINSMIGGVRDLS
jgi:hypothetical protein